MKPETHKTLTVQCPSCKAPVEWNDNFPERPFCSSSCRNKDFCAWADEDHRIAGSASYEEIMSADLEKH